MKAYSLPITLLLLLSFASIEKAHAQQRYQDTSILFKVEEAPEWTSLFYRKEGWVGGDGIFTIPLNGIDSINGAATDSTLFIFSDTILGEIVNGKFHNGFKMINNSVAILQGVKPVQEKLKFSWPVIGNGQAKSVFIPRTKRTSVSDYYWLGDGFVNHAKNNDLYIFAYRIQPTKAKVFGFREVGNTLLVIPARQKVPFQQIRQFDTDLSFEKDSTYTGSLGAGILLNTKSSGAVHTDGYLYVYGALGKKKSVTVARVKPATIERKNAWRYWDGKGWTRDKWKAASIADRASNELSVTPLPDGRYAMIFQIDGISNTIGMRIGASPVGPFGPIIPVWNCSADTKVDKDYFSYNAKAHPGLSKKGELLISYNINSFDALNDLNTDPNHYRPRFIRVIWQ